MERIWLQVTDEWDDPQDVLDGSVTWCEDKQHDGDVEYVRIDIHAQLEKKYVNVLEVAIARGEKLGYLDEDYREKLDALKEGVMMEELDKRIEKVLAEDYLVELTTEYERELVGLLTEAQAYYQQLEVANKRLTKAVSKASGILDGGHGEYGVVTTYEKEAQIVLQDALKEGADDSRS